MRNPTNSFMLQRMHRGSFDDISFGPSMSMAGTGGSSAVPTTTTTTAPVPAIPSFVHPPHHQSLSQGGTFLSSGADMKTGAVSTTSRQSHTHTHTHPATGVFDTDIHKYNNDNSNNHNSSSSNNNNNNNDNTNATPAGTLTDSTLSLLPDSLGGGNCAKVMVRYPDGSGRTYRAYTPATNTNTHTNTVDPNPSVASASTHSQARYGGGGEQAPWREDRSCTEDQWPGDPASQASARGPYSSSSRASGSASHVGGLPRGSGSGNGTTDGSSGGGSGGGGAGGGGGLFSALARFGGLASSNTATARAPVSSTATPSFHPSVLTSPLVSRASRGTRRQLGEAARDKRAAEGGFTVTAAAASSRGGGKQKEWQVPQSPDRSRRRSTRETSRVQGGGAGGAQSMVPASLPLPPPLSPPMPRTLPIAIPTTSSNTASTESMYSHGTHSQSVLFRSGSGSGSSRGSGGGSDGSKILGIASHNQPHPHPHPHDMSLLSDPALTLTAMDGKPLAASLNNMDTPFILAPRPRADSSHTGSARSTVPQSLLISASPTRTMSSSLEAEVLSNRHKRQQSTAKSHHHQQQQQQQQQHTSPNASTLHYGINPFRLEDGELFLRMRTHNRRRWAHALPSQQQVNSSLNWELNWKSLCQPVVLPLTTDYLPSLDEIRTKYTVANYSLLLDSSVCPFHKPESLLAEMVNQRLAQEFQVIDGEQHNNFHAYKKLVIGAADKASIPDQFFMILSMGHRIHFLFYIPSRGTVNVFRYMSRIGINDVNSTVSYRYRIWSKQFQRFVVMQQKFYQFPEPEHAWNLTDEILSGNQDIMSDNLRAKRIRLVVVPCNGVTKELYQENFEKLVTFLNKYCAEAMSLKFLDHDQQDNVKKEKVEEGDSSSSSSSTKKDSASSSSSTAAPSKKTLLNAKFWLRRPTSVSSSTAHDAPQWAYLRCEDTYSMRKVFHLDIFWIVCVASLMDDFVNMLFRRCGSWGLRLIQIPEFFCVPNLQMHPFRGNPQVFVPKLTAVTYQAPAAVTLYESQSMTESVFSPPPPPPQVPLLSGRSDLMASSEVEEQSIPSLLGDNDEKLEHSQSPSPSPGSGPDTCPHLSMQETSLSADVLARDYISPTELIERLLLRSSHRYSRETQSLEVNDWIPDDKQQTNWEAMGLSEPPCHLKDNCPNIIMKQVKAGLGGSLLGSMHRPYSSRVSVRDLAVIPAATATTTPTTTTTTITDSSSSSSSTSDLNNEEGTPGADDTNDTGTATASAALHTQETNLTTRLKSLATYATQTLHSAAEQLRPHQTQPHMQSQTQTQTHDDRSTGNCDSSSSSSSGGSVAHSDERSGSVPETGSTLTTTSQRVAPTYPLVSTCDGSSNGPETESQCDGSDGGMSSSRESEERLSDDSDSYPSPPPPPPPRVRDTASDRDSDRDQARDSSPPSPSSATPSRSRKHSRSFGSPTGSSLLLSSSLSAGASTLLSASPTRQSRKSLPLHANTLSSSSQPPAPAASTSTLPLSRDHVSLSPPRTATQPGKQQGGLASREVPAYRPRLRRHIHYDNQYMQVCVVGRNGCAVMM
mgnify:CR=1 FL=1